MQSGYWQDRTTADFRLVDPEATVALLPVAAVEQHGPHLPLVDGRADQRRRSSARRSSASPRRRDAARAAGAERGLEPRAHELRRHACDRGLRRCADAWTDVGRSVARAGVRKLVDPQHARRPKGARRSRRDAAARGAQDARRACDVFRVRCAAGALRSPRRSPTTFTAARSRRRCCCTSRPISCARTRSPTSKDCRTSSRRATRVLGAEKPVGIGWRSRGPPPVGRLRQRDARRRAARREASRVSRRPARDARRRAGRDAARDRSSDCRAVGEMARQPKSRQRNGRAALEDLDDCPPSAWRARSRSPSALAHGHYRVAAKAARLAGDALLYDLVPALLAAYTRFLDKPIKSDPSCYAKKAIARALVALDCEDVEFFLAGLAYSATRAGLGRHWRTRPPTCARAARSGSSRPATRARSSSSRRCLNDAEPDARLGAVRAIACGNPREAELLLRSKALAGDAEPASARRVLHGPAGRRARRVDRRSSPVYLTHADDALRELAALALGESRLDGALAPLKKAWGERVARRRISPRVASRRRGPSQRGRIRLAAVDRRGRRVRPSRSRSSKRSRSIATTPS